MKKETGVLLAGFIGLFATIGIIGLRKFVKSRKNLEVISFGNHPVYGRRYAVDDYEGVEFLNQL